MASSKLSICVVGTGSIGLRHIHLLRRMEEVRVLAAPKRPERVQELRQMGIECVDPDSDFEKLPLDGAIIASDTSLHVADALRFRSSCPLLIEKPLAVDEAAARALLAAGRRDTHVACVLRFNPGLAWLRHQLSALGAIQFVDAECISWLPTWRPSHDYRLAYSSRPAEGGVLRDLIHEIDYLLWLFGPIVSVTGSVWNSGLLGLDPGLDECANAILQTQMGSRMALRLSFVLRPPSRQLRIWGERGHLLWDALRRRASYISLEGQELDAKTWEDPTLMYADQLTGWIRFLRGEANAPLATLADGLAALRVADAIRLSSARGTEVRLP